MVHIYYKHNNHMLEDIKPIILYSYPSEMITRVNKLQENIGLTVTDEQETIKILDLVKAADFKKLESEYKFNRELSFQLRLMFMKVVFDSKMED